MSKSRFFLFLLFIVSQALHSQNNTYSKWVNPFIGTGGHGHTFPGAVAPFGMVQLSPDTRNDASWDACGGYYYYDSFIYGFSHTHLSGTGVSDLGDILFQPAYEPNFNPEDYKQRFNHASEKASPGYYTVKLENSGVKVELSATEYLGIQRYIFPKNGKSRYILIDLEHRDQLLSSSLTIENEYSIIGHRQSKQWANNQWVFFISRFSNDFEKIIVNKDSTQIYLGFNSSIDTITIRTALSFTSKKGALANERSSLHQIISDKFFYNPESVTGIEFDLIKARVNNYWNSELSRINVIDKSGSDNELVKFYSALYHCMIHPSLASDADNNYRGRDQKIHLGTHKTYHVFSLWDTYRSLHPLLSMIQKQRTKDFILTMLDQFEQGGILPVWELGSCETNCMIGFHSVPVILDAVKQGINFTEDEQQRLLKAVKHSSDLKENAYEYRIPIQSELLTLYNFKLGYIDVLNQAESVSKTLEYAYDDWCVSELFYLWGDTNSAELYKNRSFRWIGVFDVVSKSMRPKRNGNWLSPFRKNEVNNHYTEANSWQYGFAVQHQIPEMIEAYGGNIEFTRVLNELFETSSETSGRDQADISGLIGQYAHGNEPSHHMAYMYNWTSQWNKTQQLIQKIDKEFYTVNPDGLIGNEDCGQMSAWYVLSSLGIYPVCPGSGNWSLSYPKFQYSKIHMEDGLPIVIKRDPQLNSDFTSGLFKLNLDSARNTYIRKFGTQIPKYYSELYSNYGNSITQDFLDIHRQLYFSWMSLSNIEFDKAPRIKDKAKFILANKTANIKAPSQVLKDEIYTVNIESPYYPYAVMVRNMDSMMNFQGIREEFKKLVTQYPNVPGLGAANKMFVLNNDTSISLKGSALIYTVPIPHYLLNQYTNNTMSNLDLKFFEWNFGSACYIAEKPNNYEVLKLISTYNPQYTAGGPNGLVDGVLGTSEWRSGGWQGYQDQDFEVIIDLKEEIEIYNLGARFLTDNRAWIYLPRDVKFEYSKDGVNFDSYAAFEFKRFDYENSEVVPIILSKSGKRKPKARYIKVNASKYGKLPVGHPGYDFDGDAFIFIDEIMVNTPIMEELLDGR